MAGAGPYHPPRNAYGQPDFDGTWTNSSLTRVERPAGATDLTIDQAQATALEAKIMADRKAPAGDAVGGRQSEWWDGGHLARMGGGFRTSWISSPADGHLSFTPAGRQGIDKGRRAAEDYSGPEVRSLSERCLQAAWASAGPPMLNAPYNANYKIVQTRDQVAILVENSTALRIVRLGAAHAPAQLRDIMGDSVGHWEGETLVVETTNFSPAPLRAPPFYLSGQAKVVERFSRVSATELRYEFAVEDPEVLSAPVRGEMPFRPTRDALYEVACHEGNYSMEGILAGARQGERAAGSAGK